MSVRFDFREACLPEIKNMPGTGDALEGAAHDVVDKALTFAPRRTGRYAASLSTRSERAGDGWTGYAVADVPYAPFIEFGTGEPGPTPEFAPLRKGAAALGLR